MSTLHGSDNSNRSYIPHVTRPMCGTRMRLAAAEPRVTDPNLRITFDCECDFEYRMSEDVVDGQSRRF